MNQQLLEVAQVADGWDLGVNESAQGIPAGFVSLAGGIYEVRADEGEEPVWLCSPVSVTALFRDGFGRGWGRIVLVTDPEGRQQPVTLLDSDMEGRPVAVRSRLVDCGLKLRNGNGARDALTRMIREWKPAAVKISTDRLGWSDSSCKGFVLGNGDLLGGRQFHYTGNAAIGVTGPRTISGSAESWRDNVATLCVGNPLLVLSVSLAFAGPLLELMNEEGGGIHLRGASSCGKTTIQRVATSVWWNPANVGSWRVTANGVEQAAKESNSMLLSLDEIAEISGKDLDRAAYMLANGTGKLRAKANGGATPPATWRVAVLSTGEIGIAEKIAEAGRSAMAGHGVRLLDIEADRSRFGAFDDVHGCATGAEFSSRLKGAAANHYGAVGQAFVVELIARRTRIPETAQKIIDSLTRTLMRSASCSEDGQAQRAARRLAVIACAGELATRFGLTGWPPQDAINSAKEAFQLWLGSRKALVPAVEAAKERTRTFLLANANGFADRDQSDDATRPAAYGWKDAGLYYFTRESWHALHGEKAVEAARGLGAIGLLLPGDGKNLARVMPRWAAGRPRAYVIRSEIMADPMIAVS